MKAIFKPEDPSKLIIRDADKNEASLIINFLNEIKNGAPINTEAIYNGNYEVNGIIFKLDKAPEITEMPTYIQISGEVTNSLDKLPLFKIQLTPTYSTNYMSYKIDYTKWDELRLVLKELGLKNPSIGTCGQIVAKNDSGVLVDASIVIPQGLIQYINKNDSTTDNFNDSLVLSLKNTVEDNLNPDDSELLPPTDPDTSDSDTTTDDNTNIDNSTTFNPITGDTCSDCSLGA